MQTTIHPLFPHPALLLKNRMKKYLIISDLHIGFEETFKISGINLETKIETMQEELLDLINEFKPSDLIILGDLKNSINRINRSEWINVPFFLERMIEKTCVTIIKGNHDGGILPLLPKKVHLMHEKFLVIKDNILFHGHTLLTNQMNVNRLIMGHIHPIYKRTGSPLTGTQVWLMLNLKKTFLSQQELNLIVIPSFNRELSKISSGKYYGKTISPILNQLKNKINEAEILTLDGDIIGNINSLHYVL